MKTINYFGDSRYEKYMSRCNYLVYKMLAQTDKQKWYNSMAITNTIRQKR